MLKMLASLLSFVLVGCASSQQVDRGLRSSIRAPGPSLDRQYEWGSHVVPQGGHAMD